MKKPAASWFSLPLPPVLFVMIWAHRSSPEKNLNKHSTVIFSQITVNSLSIMPFFFFHFLLNKKNLKTEGQLALFLHNWEVEIYLMWSPSEVWRENRILYLAANMWQSRKVNSWYVCNLFVGLSVIQFRALEKVTKPLHVKCDMELISHGNLLLMGRQQSESVVYWKKHSEVQVLSLSPPYSYRWEESSR